MATAGQALRLCVRSCRRTPTAPRIAPRAATQFHQQPPQQFQRRTFAASPARRARGDEDEEGVDKSLYRVQETVEDVVKKLKPAEVEALQRMRKSDPSAQSLSLEEWLDRQWTKADEEAERQEPLVSNREYKMLAPRVKPNRQSFWYDPDAPMVDTENIVDEFDEDDMTSMAHGKLDEIREHRHYHRIMAWEMPLLAKLAKPFEPPAKDEVLRFRYTTYMGEHHPAEKKVVVEFSPVDLDLTPVQADKLRKLAGPRWNPEKDIIKMSSEKFEHQAQNKRYLSDLVDKLVATAKDPKDTFEDVPLDTRHHQFKEKPRFPVEWRMTEERRKELAAFRQQGEKADAAKVEEGLLVDGMGTIERFLEQPAQAEVKEAELVAVRRGGSKNARR
ncbi:37S ribosomal protein S24 [Colletotrichum gloeosporioides]|uniref:Small ribosomal subunit protein mS35 n=1 Tax=Colletotrichum gloeosporioides TaxID=474922 RepID=A0A8H4FMJ4_COLGL|nr:37S ribosomal protein S24 [Colletotrichum gloeosporioides]KAF3807590.1 37S ribosomal protein S24 [Colletotrichum gloeosporioides]